MNIFISKIAAISTCKMKDQVIHRPLISRHISAEPHKLSCGYNIKIQKIFRKIIEIKFGV